MIYRFSLIYIYIVAFGLHFNCFCLPSTGTCICIMLSTSKLLEISVILGNVYLYTVCAINTAFYVIVAYNILELNINMSIPRAMEPTHCEKIP